MPTRHARINRDLYRLPDKDAAPRAAPVGRGITYVVHDPLSSSGPLISRPVSPPKSGDPRRPYQHLYSDPRWRRLRAAQLARHPWCKMHLDVDGKKERATIADHKVPHRGNPALFFNERNLQSLCKRCHDSAKQSQEAAPRGCDADGNPLYPAEGW